MDILELTESKHCKETEDGVFELLPVKTDKFENPGKPIPKEVVITIGKRDRLLEAYFKYTSLSKNFENGHIDPNWLLTETELRSMQKAMLTMDAAEKRVQQFGIDLTTINTMENVSMMEHPIVLGYLKAMDEYDTLNTEYTDKRLERQKTANILTVQQRFIVDVFLVVTEEVSATLDPVKRYTTETLLNDPFWAQQADLIHDVFHMVVKYVLTELSIRVKKTKLIFELCETVEKVIAESVKDLPEMKKDIISSNNSTSSQSTTKAGLGSLKKATQSKK